MNWAVSLGSHHALVAALESPENLIQIDENIWQTNVNGQPLAFALIPTAVGVELWCHGQAYPVVVEPESVFKLRKHFEVKQQQQGNSHQVTAHMPGLVTQVFVEAGQPVHRGESLMVLEAMKMENELRAPAAGVVSELFATVGEQVNKGQLLCSLQPEADATRKPEP